MDVVEKLYPSIKRGSFHVNERQLVCDHLFSPLNLSHIPCGLNTHSPISSSLASPFLSSPSPAFPNPSLLLAGQACPPNFSPHGYFRTPGLSTIQTLLSYWRCCRCSIPWPGCWTAGPRTLNNPKANEPSHLDTTLHPGHNLRQTARFRPGRAPISLPRSIPSCFHFLAPCPDLQSSPAPHTFLAHLLGTAFGDKQSTHSFENFLHSLTSLASVFHWGQVVVFCGCSVTKSCPTLWPCGL